MVTLDLADTLRVERRRRGDLRRPSRRGPRARRRPGHPGPGPGGGRRPRGGGQADPQRRRPRWGSADAAAILRWAGFDDVEAAARLGADVPFCVLGGRARVTGIGEGVEPLPYEDRTFTLLTPPVHCATAAVYRAWDDLGGPEGPNGNDLEPAALAVLRSWRAGATSSTKLPVPFRCSPGAARRGSSRELPGGGSARGAHAGHPRRCHGVSEGPGATCLPGAASGCASASSCASSCACACGAS